MWDNRYRQLAEGEEIQFGDEVLDDVLGWKKTINSIGQLAPNPLYTSHRMYRRLIEEDRRSDEVEAEH